MANAQMTGDGRLCRLFCRIIAAICWPCGYHAVAYPLADWTNRNPKITAPGAADAKALPQILTENVVLGAIGRQVAT